MSMPSRAKKSRRLFRRPRKAAKVISSTGSLEKEINSEQFYKRIRERAYYIWEERGKPAGEDFDIWLQAEKEMHTKIKNK